jgi:hypothetical protein
VEAGSVFSVVGASVDGAGAGAEQAASIAMVTTSRIANTRFFMIVPPIFYYLYFKQQL